MVKKVLKWEQCSGGELVCIVWRCWKRDSSVLEEEDGGGEDPIVDGVLRWDTAVLVKDVQLCFHAAFKASRIPYISARSCACRRPHA